METTNGWDVEALLASQPVLPINAAVMEWLPTASDELVMLAVPFASKGRFDASIAAPSLMVMEPMGTPPPDCAKTDTVTTIGWPHSEGFGETATDIAVAVGGPTHSTTLPLLAA